MTNLLSTRFQMSIKWLLWPAIPIALSSALLACGERADERQPTHPASDRIVTAMDSPPVSLRLDPQSTQSRAVARDARFPFSDPPRSLAARIGALQEPAAEVFGSIEDVEVGETGRLILLDGQSSELRVFSANGEHRQTLGGEGGGPAEFRRAYSVEADSQNHVRVFGSIGRVSFLEPEADSLRFDRSLRLDTQLLDACQAAGKIYVHGPGDGRQFIHVYSSEGEHLDSFSEIYRTENQIVRHQLARGRLECVDTAGLLLLTPVALAELRVYTLSGDLEWRTDLEGFKAIKIEETPTGGTALSMPEEGFHSAFEAVPSPDGGRALFQIAYRSPDSREAGIPGSIHTFLVDLQERDATYLGDSWPRVRDWTPDRIVVSSTHPYPTLEVYNIGS